MSGIEAINIAGIAKFPGLSANTKPSIWLVLGRWGVRVGYKISHHRDEQTFSQDQGHSHAPWVASAVAVIECSYVIWQLVLLTCLYRDKPDSLWQTV